jgi:hypothetical protein
LNDSFNKTKMPINNKHLFENRLKNELLESIRSDRDGLNVLGEATLTNWRDAK